MKLVIIFLLIMLLHGAPAFGCNVCHSKNPKMVRMHEKLEFKDCFDCHGPSNIRPKERKNERSTSPMCTRCHAATAVDITQPPLTRP